MANQFAELFSAVLRVAILQDQEIFDGFKLDILSATMDGVT